MTVAGRRRDAAARVCWRCSSVALLRSHAEILRRLETARTAGAAAATGRPPGRRRAWNEDLEGATPDGGARRLVLAPGSDTLLAFLSSGCSTCVDLLEVDVDDLPLPPGLRLVVVAKDRRLERLRLFRPLVGRVEVLMSSAAWEQYRVPGEPLLPPDRRLERQCDGRRPVMAPDPDRADPEWPNQQPAPGLPFLGRPAVPTGGVDALWAASSQQVGAPSPANPAPTGGVRDCVSCGLSLSATARFCRRCGSAQHH